MTVVSTYSTDNIFIQEPQSWKVKGLVWPNAHLAVRVPRLPYCHCDSPSWSSSLSVSTRHRVDGREMFVQQKLNKSKNKSKNDLFYSL